MPISKPLRTTIASLTCAASALVLVSPPSASATASRLTPRPRARTTRSFLTTITLGMTTVHNCCASPT